MTAHPVPSNSGAGFCSDCGTALEGHHDHAGEARCPACFEKYLFDVDVGFLDDYRRFGAYSPRVVAETCLRGLVLANPDHRKVLAMTIFEQYVQAVKDLAGLFIAFQRRNEAPILKSFLEFRLDARSGPAFYNAIQSVNDVDLLAALDLPAPRAVAALCPHLDEEEAYSVAVAIYHLVQDLRKTTEKGTAVALALSEAASHIGGGLIASNASWLPDGPGPRLTPDQVAMLVLDPVRRTLVVQGLTADENALGVVVDAIDTATRAASNLIFAYLQTRNL